MGNVKALMARESAPASVAEAITQFTLDMYKTVSQTEGDASLFMSPSNIFVVLAMLYAGARGTSLQQLSSVLHLEGELGEREFLREMQKVLTTLMEENENVILTIANAVYIDKSTDIIDSFRALAKESFDGKIHSIDLKKDPEGSRATINTWVQSETKSKIKELIPEGSIKPETAMILVSAIYFKGEWSTPFDDEYTRTDLFHLTKKTTVNIDMMHGTFSDMRYERKLGRGYQVLEIMYTGGELGMLILLPNDIEGLCDVENKINMRKLKEAADETTYQKVAVTIPKFKLESSWQMKSILSTMGLTDAFDGNKADFSGISDDQLYVSEIFHKTFVDVNEVGTEAAAATAAAIAVDSCSLRREKPVTFTADHPFMVAIWDHRIDAPLFMGRYTGNDN